MKNQTKHNAPKMDAVEAMPELVRLLTKMAPDEREKAISAARILLGTHQSAPGMRSVHEATTQSEVPPVDGVSGKAVAWLKKHAISREQLDQIFSIDDNTFDVIAAKLPGKSKRQQTVEAYVTCGLKSFLQSGEPSFTDKEGRQLCQKVGCYDPANHHNYIKAFGNRIGGSKDGGWKLTNPGLTEAAQIIRQITGGANAGS